MYNPCIAAESGRRRQRATGPHAAGSRARDRNGQGSRNGGAHDLVDRPPMVLLPMVFRLRDGPGMTNGCALPASCALVWQQRPTRWLVCSGFIWRLRMLTGTRSSLWRSAFPSATTASRCHCCSQRLRGRTCHPLLRGHCSLATAWSVGLVPMGWRGQRFACEWLGSRLHCCYALARAGFSLLGGGRWALGRRAV